jgi:polyhydroxyalkanoate synthase subunit PhaC
MSPSNFPATNPEVIQTAIRTRAGSLVPGMQNLIDDLQKGRITRVDESAFEVGRNLAVTPGAVVFENELVQLIQYAPQTADVEKTPLLIVPPCINKFYLLDLGAGNSLVEYAVAQGHQASTRPSISGGTTTSPSGSSRRDIAGVDRIHALGFCVGGTILSCAAAVLAARGEDKLATMPGRRPRQLRSRVSFRSRRSLCARMRRISSSSTADWSSSRSFFDLCGSLRRIFSSAFSTESLSAMAASFRCCTR